jgi:hypothetical protein
MLSVYNYAFIHSAQYFIHVVNLLLSVLLQRSYRSEQFAGFFL